MQPHTFLFKPGIWLGEGTIQLNLSREPLSFHTRWEVADQKGKNTPCTQVVEVGGLSEKMHNTFQIEIEEGGALKVHLANETIGEVMGQGVFDERLIAWEYGRSNSGDFEGYEVFEAQEDGSYKFHSEFMSQDQLRSNIAGRIWYAQDQKIDQSPKAEEKTKEEEGES